MRLFQEAHYHFLAVRRRAFVVSGIFVVLGLVSIFFHRGLNAGVEFTGGTLAQVAFTEPTDVAELRDLVNSAGISGEQIQPLRGGATENQFLFRIPSIGDGSQTEVDALLTGAFTQAFGDSGFDIRSLSGIESKVGSEFQRRAVVAVLLSFMLTLIYLAFRFEWRFGVAAVIATLHDILITFGFISALNIEISLATVAAILTIIGYSLNDTIVVFDRVRENFKKKRKESYEDTLDRSINETLPRTVLTSGTTLVALVSLMVLGGTVIRPFATVLVIGVVVGTYSSIFVASPALLELHRWMRRRAAAAAHATG